MASARLGYSAKMVRFAPLVKGLYPSDQLRQMTKLEYLRLWGNALIRLAESPSHTDELTYAHIVVLMLILGIRPIEERVRRLRPSVVVAPLAVGSLNQKR